MGQLRFKVFFVLKRVYREYTILDKRIYIYIYAFLTYFSFIKINTNIIISKDNNKFGK